jgi:uncharacterized protein YqeY
MGLIEKIEGDLREAIKSKEEVKLRTLRMLKADIMAEKTRGTADLPEEKVLELVLRASKKRKESIDEYTKAGRNDLAAREADELAVIESYLPKQLGEDEVAAAIDNKIKELGEVSKKDFGKIMGAVMKDLKGQADGAVVKAVLTRKLESL